MCDGRRVFVGSQFGRHQLFAVVIVKCVMEGVFVGSQFVRYQLFVVVIVKRVMEGVSLLVASLYDMSSLLW